MDNRLPPLEPKRRRVYVKVIFLKVGEIDTLKEKFTADVFIQARWRESELDNKRVSEKDLTGFWSPRLLVHNVLDSTKDKTWKEVVYSKNKEGYIVEKRHIKGHFSEKLELQDFPFDCQILSLQITSELPDTKVEIMEDDKEISAINVNCFVDEQEWYLYDYVESYQEVKTKEFSTKRYIKFPWLVVGFSAVRRGGFFAWNILLVMTLISSISIATFAVAHTLVQNRLQLSITLMLTSVTFKSVANANTPKISYYTHLDRYVLFALLFTYIVCAWHAIISRFTDPSLAGQLDFWAFVSFCIIFVTFHSLYGGFLIIQYLLRRKDLKLKETKYEERALQLLGQSWKINRQQQKEMRRWKPFRRSRVRAEITPEPEPNLTFLMMDEDDT